MNAYEHNLQEAYEEGLDVKEKYLKSDADALINGNRVALNKRKLTTTKEKDCKLAEERGHFHTTVGNILDLSKAENRKQELKARLWAYNEKIGLSGLISAYERGYQTPEEVAEYLNVTESFLSDALECYRQKYGVDVWMDNYRIQFEPYFTIGKLYMFIAPSFF